MQKRSEGECRVGFGNVFVAAVILENNIAVLFMTNRKQFAGGTDNRPVNTTAIEMMATICMEHCPQS